SCCALERFFPGWECGDGTRDVKRAPRGPPTTGRNRLDQYLPCLELADAVWRLQGVGLRPRERHPGDGALHPDEIGLGRPPGDPSGLVRELTPAGSTRRGW